MKRVLLTAEVNLPVIRSIREPLVYYQNHSECSEFGSEDSEFRAKKAPEFFDYSLECVGEEDCSIY